MECCRWWRRESPSSRVRHVTAERYFLQPVSQTFHGRDIFSPVAGWLSKGVAPAEFGPEITDYVRLPLPAVERVADEQSAWRGAEGGQVRQPHHEPRANSKLPALFAATPPHVKLLIAGEDHRAAYAARTRKVQREEFFAIIGSSGYLEIAARQESAAEKLSVREGARPSALVFGA